MVEIVSEVGRSDPPARPDHEQGLLDTGAVIDLVQLKEAGKLPRESAISAITLAELTQGVAMAKDPSAAVARAQVLSDADGRFDPLPFDAEAARHYGTLVAHVMAVGRDPRPRRIDLMIASVAAANGLPLFTTNAKDFVGIEAEVTVVSC